MEYRDRRRDKKAAKGRQEENFWGVNLEDEEPPLKQRTTAFSLDFLSKVQKQAIAAVLLFLVALSAKYSSDPTSGAVLNLYRTALSPQNDYSVALNDLARQFLGGENNIIAAVKSEGQMVMPVEGTVVAGFGWQISPLDKEKRFFTGIDIAAPLGTNVQAPMTGTVVKTGSDNVLGRYVKLDHGNGLVSLLGNLGEVIVKDKQKLAKGDTVGTLGFTAAVKRPWLHWEVRKNNEPIDPRSLLMKGSKL